MSDPSTASQPDAETKEELPPWPGHQYFVFDAPLYEAFGSTPSDGSVALVCGSETVDGYCIQCGDRSVFVRAEGPNNPGISHVGHMGTRFFQVVYKCTRAHQHEIRVHAYTWGDGVGKVGQYPSLADITNAAEKLLRKGLDPIDRKELNRAVGLASHGVGIGSFVYLRRVFERLIGKRIASSGLERSQFDGKRMTEKIDLLKDHLPKFLVDHSSIYGILSLGVHELTEEKCLAFYDVLHESVTLILDEDARKQEEIARRDRLSKAIKSFQKE
jgi:hypothetical protein